MIKKIVITGPESSGKTTLAMQLANALQTSWVPEYARLYLDDLGRPYRKNDLLDIAKGQIGLEEVALKKAKRFLVSDTDLITIKIWSAYKYDTCDPFILDTIEKRAYDLYLLCDSNIPWEFDPQRENPENRSVLYDLYKKELEKYQKVFFELKGNEQERLEHALRYVSNV